MFGLSALWSKALSNRVDPMQVTKMMTIIGSNVAGKVNGTQILENGYYIAQKSPATSLWSFEKVAFVSGGDEAHMSLGSDLDDNQIFTLMELGELGIRKEFKKHTPRNDYEDWKLIREARARLNLSAPQP
jgi:hypothetical protein